ncbi:MAG: hypothetical protein MZV63_12055 [Marinilabiliales bacterium]|nr:hypothetical protein [Marinilabiliales bacterium]
MRSDVPGGGCVQCAASQPRCTSSKDWKRRWGKHIDPDHAELKTLGLNHLSWHRGFTVEGEDVWPQVIQGFIDELKKEEHPEWDTAHHRSPAHDPQLLLAVFLSHR